MLRSILLTFGVRLLSAVMNFLVIILLSQYLGPEGKGICSRYIVIVSNALIFCDLIGGPALVYLASKYKIKNMLFPSYSWSAITSVMVISVFFFLKKIETVEFIHLAVLSFLNSIIAVHQNILSGRQEFQKLNVIIFVQALLSFVTLKLLFFNGAASNFQFLFSLYIAWGLAALLGLIFVLSIKDEEDPISFGSFFSSAFKFGFINQAGHILQFFNQRLSYFLLGEKTLGIFSNATTIGESVWMASSSIATVQYGKISNIEDEKKASSISLVLLKLNLVVCSCGALLLVFLPDEFFLWMFGKDFSGIHAALVYLFPGLVFYSGYLILGHHFSGRGEFVKNVYAISLGLIFTLSGLAIVYFSTILYTLQIAALITSASYFGNFLLALILFKRKANFSFRHFLPSKSDYAFILEELKIKK